MARRTTPNPTNAELTILQVLWSRGPSTVGEVVAELNRAKPTGYTTALKLLQIMTEKRLVKRDERERSHRYEAAVTEERTLKRMAADLVERAFGGSAMRLVLHALDGRKASAEELARIREFLDEIVRKRS